MERRVAQENGRAERERDGSVAFGRDGRRSLIPSQTVACPRVGGFGNSTDSCVSLCYLEVLQNSRQQWSPGWWDMEAVLGQQQGSNGNGELGLGFASP